GGMAGTQFTPSAIPGVVYTVTATDGGSITGSSTPFATLPPVALRMETHPVQTAVGGAAVEVRIFADAGSNQVDGVQFHLNFNPTQLAAVDADGQGSNGVNLQTSPAFARTIANTVNPATGVVTFAVSRDSTQGPVSGTILLGSLWVRGLAVGMQPVNFEAGSIEVAFTGLPLGYTVQNGAVDVRAKGLRFLVQPVRGAHSVALGMQPMVAITDASGAVITGDSTSMVTLGIRPGTGMAGASLACGQTTLGVTQAQVTNGIATFTGCAISASGADYELQATSTAADVAAGGTGKFNVTFAGDTDANCRVSVVDVSLVVTHYGKVMG
ncbi:MAG: hypothetical protein NTZ05_07010, partial [Chloroflexi bacterium]|nr:hypothetical protein [Chloroflexota bacterium]